MNYELANEVVFNEVKEDYPKIEVENLPQNILMELKQVYAGMKSEFTSVSQYLYHHFILWTEPRLNNVSDIMQKISITEMKHYEFIAQILLNSKIDPKNCVYIDGNKDICDYWKASNVNYDKAIVKMLESDIKLEQAGINAYKEIINNTDSENLRRIINRIILDELSHLEYFTAVLQALKK